jgi:superfamily II DNA or RNA helicase
MFKENLLKSNLQEIWSNISISKGVSGLYAIAPRSGKSQLALKIASKIKAKKILVVYPDNKIKLSWQEDIKKLKFKENITFTTYLSLHKHIDKYDLVCLDEIHATSEAQRLEIQKLLKINKIWIGLSGSLSKTTVKELNEYFPAKVIIEYSIEQAIKDGLIANYEIHVVSCELDDNVKTANSKGKLLTEKKKCDNYGYVIESLKRQGKSTMLLALARMRIIQNSLGKINKTKELLKKFKNERILIFTGLTKTANILGEFVHHSKNENEKEFIKFSKGISKFNHMAVCRIGQSGVNFFNLDRIVLNYFSSNQEDTLQKICRCLLLEENPDKTSKIYIVCSTEDFERNWLRKALQMFDQNKIYYE